MELSQVVRTNGLASETIGATSDCFADAEPRWLSRLEPDWMLKFDTVTLEGRWCLRSRESLSAIADDWDCHWGSLQGSFTGYLFSFYRRQIRSRSVAHALRQAFNQPGVYVECGCGSGETSSRLTAQTGQEFLALDFAWYPLSHAIRQQCYAGAIQADIRRLPFPEDALDGIWNLGVLEHFQIDEQLAILAEFRRVLRPGGKLVLWWPPPLGLDRLVLSPFPSLFPDEPGRATAAEVVKLLAIAGFSRTYARIDWTDACTELIVTATC